MAIGANSYGSAAEVAGKTPRYANSAMLFDASTNPTLTSVEGWIDNVSGIVNGFMAALGFAIPVTQADVLETLSHIVTEQVALLVEAARGSGRYAPSSKAIAGRGAYMVMSEELRAMLDAMAAGFEILGASRTNGLGDQIGARTVNDAGDTVRPIFQRTAFGNSFKDWDR